MKKELIPITLLSLLLNSPALLATEDQSNDKQQPQTGAVEEKAESVPDKNLTECLEMLGKKQRWTQIAKIIKSSPADGATLWIEALNKNATDEVEKDGKLEGDPGAKQHAIGEYKKNKMPDYLQCIGYSFVMAPREDGFEAGRKKTSGDGRVKCYNEGFYTMDYEACGKLIDAYDMASVAQVGLQTFQSIDFQKTASDASQEYSQDASNPTSALEAQKKTIKKQADIATTQAAFHAAKVAAMWSYYDKMPTEEDLTNNCNHLFNADAKFVISKEGDFLPSKGGDLDGLCAMTAQGSVNFLGNSAAKDDIKRIMAEETMNAVAKTAQGALLNKQARKIKGAIDQVNAFDPSQVVMVPETPDLCLSNPNDESCKLADTRSDVDLAGNGFTVTGDWGGTNATTRKEGDLDEGGIAGSGTDTNRIGPDSIGTPLADNSTAGGFVSAPPASGTVESGGSTTGGGGGGSGAGAVGLPSGGGSGGQNQAASSGEDKSNTKLAYAGGTGGKAYGASSGRKATSSKDNKNPFDDLFGKKKAATNNVLNFRDPASTEIGAQNGNSLFEMISNRYRVSQEKKRLLEYEVIEK